MRLEVSTVNLAAPDPAALADFYRRLLGYDLGVDEPDYVTLRDPGGGVGLAFQQEDGHTPPVWPAGAGDQQMQVHLEIRVDELEPAVGVLDDQRVGEALRREGVAHAGVAGQDADAHDPAVERLALLHQPVEVHRLVGPVEAAHADVDDAGGDGAAVVADGGDAHGAILADARLSSPGGCSPPSTARAA